MTMPRNYKGHSYWKDYQSCREYAQIKGLTNLPETRFVYYENGWAIQKHKSGPYWLAGHGWR